MDVSALTGHRLRSRWHHGDRCDARTRAESSPALRCLAAACDSARDLVVFGNGVVRAQTQPGATTLHFGITHASDYAHALHELKGEIGDSC